ncbi:MAG: hypothetical protein J7K68_04790 [Candidatus Diapherotrites archaeon]|nr:hypothetical protein [Candidatus Diapherotrites archaeon]
MPTKSPEEVKEEILEVLDDVPRTVDEIKRLAGTSWLGTKKALESLDRLGVVKTAVRGKRKYYYRPTGKTWFGLPIREKDKEVLEYIFWKAREIWKEKGVEPKRVNLQKVAVHVAEDLKLDIPVFRYLYGQMTVLKEAPSEKPARPSIPGIEGSIEEAVMLYSGPAYLAKEVQYKKETMRFYGIKKEIEQNWHREFESGKLSKRLIDWLMEAPRDEYITEAIKEVISLYAQALKEENPVEYSEPLREVFSKMWDVIATRLAHLDLKSKGYSEEDLEELSKVFGNRVEEAKYALDEFENMLTPVKLSSEIESLKGSVQRSSGNEQGK